MPTCRARGRGRLRRRNREDSPSLYGLITVGSRCTRVDSNEDRSTTGILNPTTRCGNGRYESSRSGRAREVGNLGGCVCVCVFTRGAPGDKFNDRPRAGERLTLASGRSGNEVIT